MRLSESVVRPSHKLQFDQHLVDMHIDVLNSRHKLGLHHRGHFVVARRTLSEQGIDLVDEYLGKCSSFRVKDGLYELTIQGCTFLASENSPATSLLDSPNHLLVLCTCKRLQR